MLKTTSIEEFRASNQVCIIDKVNVFKPKFRLFDKLFKCFVDSLFPAFCYYWILTSREPSKLKVGLLKGQVYSHAYVNTREI